MKKYYCGIDCDFRSDKFYYVLSVKEGDYLKLIENNNENILNIEDLVLSMSTKYEHIDFRIL